MTLDRYGLRMGRWSLSPGALFGTAALLCFGVGPVLRACLLAAFFHELGHLIACALLGVSVMRGRLSLLGAELTLGTEVGGGTEIAVALAGPLSNFMVSAALLMADRGKNGLLLAGAGILLGGFNLLPIIPLDGSRVLHGLLLLLGHPDGKAILRRFSRAAAVLLLTVGITLAAAGNRSLLLVAIWLAAGQLPIGSSVPNGKKHLYPSRKCGL